MKVLWLTSWYPNKLNKTNGDFIQRHARAVSLYCNVQVIHAEEDKNHVLNKPVEISEHHDGNLKEKIILFRAGKLFANKFFSFIKYKKLFKKEIKKYIAENGFPDIVHVQNAIKAGVMALWMKKKFNIDYVITDQWTIYNSQAPDAYENRSFIFKKFAKQIFSNASLFISVSKNLAEIISKKITAVPFTIAYNVVDTKYFFYKDESVNQPFSFVHVSTLKEQKNPEAIIDAFISFQKIFPNSRLIIVGEVPAEINKYYTEKKLPGNLIQFLGFIPYEKLAPVVQQCHAFVLFSRRENMPCVVSEALCCGLPVITSIAGGVAEVIDETNGIVIYDYKTEALTNAMINMYNNYHQYNKKNIAAEAAKKFSYETIGKQITVTYQAVLTTKNSK